MSIFLGGLIVTSESEQRDAKSSSINSFSFRSIINNGFGRKALKKHSISHFGILIARRYRIFWHLIRDPKNAPRLGSWIEGLIMEIFYESLENKTTTEITILSSQSGSEELTFIIHIPVISFNGRNHHFRCCDKAIIVFGELRSRAPANRPAANATIITPHMPSSACHSIQCERVEIIQKLL